MMMKLGAVVRQVFSVSLIAALNHSHLLINNSLGTYEYEV